MKNFIVKICIPLVLAFCIIGIFASSALAATNLSPVGYWQTTDEKTNAPASIIQIWQQNGMLYGKIVKIFPQGGHSASDVCTQCKGDLHNKPLVGMTILIGLTQQNEGWAGKILAPRNGNTYDATVKLPDDGNKLEVHIKAGLGGRTENWSRVRPTA